MTDTESEELHRGSVRLPEHLLERVDERLPRTEFETRSEYVEYVLQEVLYRVEQETDGSQYDSVDEGEVESRLRSLGYLDE
jgi:metal-responsive CopG/Arc/MetJ family transcriptional regulator